MSKLQDSNRSFRDQYASLSRIVRDLQSYLPPDLANRLSRQLTRNALAEYGRIADDAIGQFDQAMRNFDGEYQSHRSRVADLETSLRSEGEQRAEEARERIEREQAQRRSPEPPQSYPSQAQNSVQCNQARQQIQEYQNYLRNSLPPNVRAQVMMGIEGTQSWIRSNC